MALIETLVDTFSTADTSKWTYPSGTSVSGGLMLVATANSPTINGNLSVARYDLTGSSIYAKVVAPTGGVGAVTDFSLASPVGGSDLTFEINTDNATIAFLVRTGYADSTAAAHTIAYDPVAMAYLRFSHNTGGASVTFSTSPSGAAGSWTTQRVPSVPGFGGTGITSLQVVTSSFNVSGSSTASKWSNVNTLSGGGTGTTGSKVSSLQDPWTSLDTTKWAEQSAADVTEASGTLSINPAATGFPNLHALVSYDLTDSSILYKFQPPSGGVGIQAGLVLSSGTAGTRLRLQYLADTAVLSCRNEVGSADSGHIDIPYNATAHQWLRIRHDSTGNGSGTPTLYWEASADQVTWVVLRSTTTIPAYLAAVTPTFSADSTSLTGTVVPARFSNLNAVVVTGGGSGGGGTGVLAKAGTFVESFDYVDPVTSLPAIDPTKWNVVGNVVESNSAAVIQAANTGFPHLQTITQYDLVGSNYLCLVNPANGTGDETTFVVNSITDGTDLRLTFRTGWANTTGAPTGSGVIPGQLVANSYVNYQEIGTQKAVNWDLSKSVWIRIIDDGVGHVTWSYSADNKLTWVALRTEASPFWLSATRLTLGADNTISAPGGGGGSTGGGGTGSGTFLIDPTVAPPAGGNVTVDFRTNMTVGYNGATIAATPLRKHQLGWCLLTDDGNNAGIKNSGWKAKLKELGQLAWRIPIGWNGAPVSAAGSQNGKDVLPYTRAVKDMNGYLVAVIGGPDDGRASHDNNFSDSDVTNIVNYFKNGTDSGSAKISVCVIGNEFTNGGNNPASPNDYMTKLPARAAAIKAADSSVLVSAPALPDMKNGSGNVTTALSTSGANLDFVSAHAYQGQSQMINQTGAGVSSWTSPSVVQDYEDIMAQYHSYALAAGTPRPNIWGSMEEFNLAQNLAATNGSKGTSYSNVGSFSWENSVFIAAVIGHCLNAGANAYGFADSNGYLSLMNSGDHTDMPGTAPGTNTVGTVFPAYHALSMWTGRTGNTTGLAHRGVPTQAGDGYMVSVARGSLNSMVRVFACNNGKIMIVNMDTADHTATIALGGIKAGTTAAIWQTQKALPFNDPQKIADITYSGGLLSITVPAGTVTSVEL